MAAYLSQCESNSLQAADEAKERKIQAIANAKKAHSDAEEALVEAEKFAVKLENERVRLRDIRRGKSEFTVEDAEFFLNIEYLGGSVATFTDTANDLADASAVFKDNLIHEACAAVEVSKVQNRAASLKAANSYREAKSYEAQIFSQKSRKNIFRVRSHSEVDAEFENVIYLEDFISNQVGSTST